MNILVYITDQKDRVLSGASLSLRMEDDELRQACLADLGKALKADVVQLKNGDHIVIKAK